MVDIRNLERDELRAYYQYALGCQEKGEAPDKQLVAEVSNGEDGTPKSKPDDRSASAQGGDAGATPNFNAGANTGASAGASAGVTESPGNEGGVGTVVNDINTGAHAGAKDDRAAASSPPRRDWSAAIVPPLSPPADSPMSEEEQGSPRPQGGQMGRGGRGRTRGKGGRGASRGGRAGNGVRAKPVAGEAPQSKKRKQPEAAPEDDASDAKRRRVTEAQPTRKLRSQASPPKPKAARVLVGGGKNWGFVESSDESSSD